ncbi:MAG: FAD-binding oxidoreductase [Acidobacteriota bacterium]|nr:FAD-binding oxidoreductase [Acidobacteriota bacterium]
MQRPGQPYPEIAWGAWGDPARAVDLSGVARELLRDGLGVDQPGRPIPEPAALELGEPRAGDALVELLCGLLGREHVLADAGSRARHMRGRSTLDLLRLRAGDVGDAPDLVLLPGCHEEVGELLSLCATERVAVVPFGGGTSVVGGLAPRREGFAAVAALDLRRMNALAELDPDSRTATLEPGLRGPEAEMLLAEHGFTIGHHPQSFEYATIGGFAATRSSGQASAGYGRFDERVVGVRLATPAGTLELGRAPRSAAGPDLRQLVLGSEGAFGVITSVRVEVTPLPEARLYEGWWLPSFPDGLAALRRLAQDGPLPSVLRLSDEAESALNLARPAELGGASARGCLAIVGHEGAHAEVARRRALCASVMRECGGELDEAAGEGWRTARYSGPYLRDALLDAGALAETLETATFWSALPGLHEAVGAALRESLGAQGAPAVVMCHVSHVYRSGASLYFTVACRQLEDPLAQWRAAKQAAIEAILAVGATVTHHHGVGTDHRDALAREIGPLGIAVLAAVKGVLDPQGIMNPGVLVA